jgi:hypothetical protein
MIKSVSQSDHARKKKKYPPQKPFHILNPSAENETTSHHLNRLFLKTNHPDIAANKLTKSLAILQIHLFPIVQRCTNISG